jgi:hypothetical protein
MAIERPLVEAYWIDEDRASRFGGSPVGLEQILDVMPVDVVKIAPFVVTPLDGVASQGSGFEAGIARLRSAGARVQLSLGGEEYSGGWNDPSDPEALAAAVKELVERLGADGVDIDNEDANGMPGERFEATVAALRAALGDDALLTCVTYEPWRDLPWLRNVGHLFDWVTTMSYWDETDAQIALWRKYAEVVGGENVVVGVACPGCAAVDAETRLETVREVAEWISREGPEAAGGMMLWCLSAGPMSERFHEAITANLTSWRAPRPRAARG